MYVCSMTNDCDREDDEQPYTVIIGYIIGAISIFTINELRTLVRMRSAFLRDPRSDWKDT